MRDCDASVLARLSHRRRPSSAKLHANDGHLPVDSLLDVEMVGNETKFDQVKLPQADLLLAFRAPTAIEGTGSYHCRNSRVVASLPTKPDLDALLWSESDQLGPEVRCAVPAFNFSSR